MQITIVQVEIEEAIINHVKSQVAVLDDQVITVDLRATRGADGYQAVIDIRRKEGGSEAKPASPEPTSPTPTLTPSPAPLKPLGIEKAVNEDKPAPKPDPIKQEPKVAKPEDIAEIKQRVDNEAAVAEPIDDVPAKPKSPLFSPKPKPTAVEQVGGAVEEPAAPTQSIFGSLKKPVNA